MRNDLDVGLSVLTSYAVIADQPNIGNRLISRLFGGHLSQSRRLAVYVRTGKQLLAIYPEHPVYGPFDVSDTSLPSSFSRSWYSVLLDELSEHVESSEEGPDEELGSRGISSALAIDESCIDPGPISRLPDRVLLEIFDFYRMCNTGQDTGKSSKGNTWPWKKPGACVPNVAISCVCVTSPPGSAPFLRFQDAYEEYTGNLARSSYYHPIHPHFLPIQTDQTSR
jgi:hypothetical protein